MRLKLKNTFLVSSYDGNAFQLVFLIKKNQIRFVSIATTLDKAEATSTWQPLQWEPGQRLAIRQLMLGHTAKENEFNVIEVSDLIKLKRERKWKLSLKCVDFL